MDTKYSKLQNVGRAGSECSLAVGDEDDSTECAGAAQAFSEGNPTGAIEQTDQWHESSTPLVVGTSDQPRYKATDETKAVFCRQDSQSAIFPTAKYDLATIVVPTFYKENKEICELLSLQDNSASEGDYYGSFESNSDKPIVRQESNQESENLSDNLKEDKYGSEISGQCKERLESNPGNAASEEDNHISLPIIGQKSCQEETMKKPAKEAGLKHVYTTPAAKAYLWPSVGPTSVIKYEKEGVDTDSSLERNSSLPIPVPENTTETLTKSRRVDNVTSNAQQNPTGKVHNYDLKSHISEEQKPSYFLPFSEQHTHNGTFTYSDDVQEIVPVSIQSIDAHKSNNEKPEDDVNLYAEYRKDIEWSEVKSIGRGATAIVKLARDKKSGDNVAAKQFKKTITKGEIDREVDVMRHIKADNIVQFIKASRENNQYYIFMEYMSGGSVEDRLGKNCVKKLGPLGVPVIRSYSRQLLSAVVYLHDKSIAHRDINCANLLLDDRHKILRLTDFGLAVWFYEEEKFYEAVGSWNFMAPEVKKYDNITPNTAVCDEMVPYTAKCDIYSTGCVVVDMADPEYGLKGIPNYVNETHELPMPSKFINTDLQNMVVQCLQVDVNERPTARRLQELFPLSTGHHY